MPSACITVPGRVPGGLHLRKPCRSLFRELVAVPVVSFGAGSRYQRQDKERKDQHHAEHERSRSRHVAAFLKRRLPPVGLTAVQLACRKIAAEATGTLKAVKPWVLVRSLSGIPYLDVTHGQQEAGPNGAASGNGQSQVLDWIQCSLIPLISPRTSFTERF